MLLRNIFLKSLRDNRAGVIATGVGLGLVAIITASQYPQIITGTGAARAAMAAEMAKVFQAFSFLIGDVVALDTIGGFLTTRTLSFMPVLFGLWAAIVAVGLIRGEEQQGALDVLLSTPHSRASVLRQKVAALVVMIAIAHSLLFLGLLLGVIVAGESLPVGDLLLEMLNLAVITAFWAGVGLLIGQFVLVRRTASSITGGLLFGTFLLNNVLGGIPSLNWLTWLLPFRYFTASKPLVAGRAMDWAAWSFLVALTIGLFILSGLIFSRRDIGSTFRVIPGRTTDRQEATQVGVLMRSVFGKSLRDLLWPAVWWSVALGVYAVMIVATAKEALEPMRQMLNNMGWVAAIVGNLATYEAYVSIALFTYLPVLLAVFAITQIESWSSDEEEGRFELLAAMPLPRWRLIAARYVAIFLALLFIMLVVSASLLIGAGASGITLDAGRVWQAAAAALPLGMVVAAFGLAVATWLKRPGAAMPLTIGVVVAMFFLELFAPLLGLPQAVLNLSIFHLYGKPMIEGIQWGGLLALIVATLLLAVLSILGLNRRDIAK